MFHVSCSLPHPEGASDEGKDGDKKKGSKAAKKTKKGKDAEKKKKKRKRSSTESNEPVSFSCLISFLTMFPVEVHPHPAPAPARAATARRSLRCWRRILEMHKLFLV